MLLATVLSACAVWEVRIRDSLPTLRPPCAYMRRQLAALRAGIAIPHVNIPVLLWRLAVTFTLLSTSLATLTLMRLGAALNGVITITLPNGIDKVTLDILRHHVIVVNSGIERLAAAALFALAAVLAEMSAWLLWRYAEGE